MGSSALGDDIEAELEFERIKRDWFDAPEFVDQMMSAAERHLRRSRATLSRHTDGQDLAMRVGVSTANQLRSDADDWLERHDRHVSLFSDMYLARFDTAFDEIDLLKVLASSLNSKMAGRAASIDTQPKITVLIELHAHAVLVASEILYLLRGGWPSAAEARWRTLHEIEVILLFLLDAPKTVAERYLASRDADLARMLRRRELRFDGPGARSLRSEIRGRGEEARRRYGSEILRPYGWAAKWLRVKKRKSGRKEVTFAYLERKVMKRTRRPAYVMASNQVHASRLGAVAALVQTEGHLHMGRRVDGVADTALRTMWSLSGATAGFLEFGGQMGLLDDYPVWEEVQFDLTLEADVLTRHAEAERLTRLGDLDEAQRYLAANSLGLRFVRDVSAPLPRQSE